MNEKGEYNRELGARISKAIIYNNLDIKSIATALGITVQTLNNWRSGRTGVPPETIPDSAEHLNVSPVWLITGLEDFERAGRIDVSQDPVYPTAYLDGDSTSTPSEIIDNQAAKPTAYLRVPGFLDCEIAVNTYGHSMYPTIESGQIILCKRVHDKSLVIYGEIYLIVTSEYRMVKRVRRSKIKGNILATSDNHNGHNHPDGHTYDPLEVPLDKILELYLVKGSIKRHMI